MVCVCVCVSIIFYTAAYLNSVTGSQMSYRNPTYLTTGVWKRSRLCQDAGGRWEGIPESRELKRGIP